MDNRTIDRVAELVERAVPWVARVERPTRLLTIAGGVATAWLVGLVIRGATPDTVLDWVGLLLLAGLLVAPVVVLVLFVITLRQLLGLPEQLRGLPRTTREQGARLSTAISALRQPRVTGARGSARGLWDVRGVLVELAGLAEPFLGLAGLVRLPFLLLVAAAGVVVIVEVVVAVLAVVLVVAV